MSTFFWVFICVAFGLMLFSSVQDKVPDELSFLKNLGAGSATEQVAPGTQKFSYEGWNVVESVGVTELVKGFSGPLEVNGQSYDAPEIGILCDKGTLNVRIDSRLPTTGLKGSPVTFAGQDLQWDKGASGMNLLSPDPRAVLRGLLKQSAPAKLTLSYRDLGSQATSLDVTGLGELVKRMAPTCQP